MKKVLMILVGMILVGSVVQAEPVEKGAGPSSSVDLVGVGTIYVPKDDDSYDLGAGMEIQVRFWLNPYMGAALAMGSASYVVNDQDFAFAEGRAHGRASLDGNVNLTPIGVSLLLRPIMTSRISLTLEGGVRYVFVDSQAEVEIAATGPAGSVYIDDTLDMEDGVVGIAAATLEIKLTEQIFVLGGAGYQFDLEKGDVTLLDDSIFQEQHLGKNKLEALIVQAGVGVRF